MKLRTFYPRVTTHPGTQCSPALLGYFQKFIFFLLLPNILLSFYNVQQAKKLFGTKISYIFDYDNKNFCFSKFFSEIPCQNPLYLPIFQYFFCPLVTTQILLLCTNTTLSECKITSFIFITCELKLILTLTHTFTLHHPPLTQ